MRIRDTWAWGDIRPLTMEHPFGGQPMIGKIFKRGPFPWGGDSQTVSQAQRSLKIPTYNPTGIANLRMVLDVGEWENNTFVLAGGQSGNPFSPIMMTSSVVEKGARDPAGVGGG